MATGSAAAEYEKYVQMTTERKQIRLDLWKMREVYFVISVTGLNNANKGQDEDNYLFLLFKRIFFLLQSLQRNAYNV
jgi:hypothetical protein